MLCQIFLTGCLTCKIYPTQQTNGVALHTFPAFGKAQVFTKKSASLYSLSSQLFSLTSEHYLVAESRRHTSILHDHFQHMCISSCGPYHAVCPTGLQCDTWPLHWLYRFPRGLFGNRREMHYYINRSQGLKCMQYYQSGLVILRTLLEGNLLCLKNSLSSDYQREKT